MKYNKQLNKYTELKDCFNCPKYDRVKKACIDNGEICEEKIDTNKLNLEQRVSKLETQLDSVVNQIVNLVDSQKKIINEINSIKQELNA